MDSIEAYKADLAYIHDVGFGDFARNSAPALLEILRQNGINKGLVADLGCGSGLWARELSDAGYGVLGNFSCTNEAKLRTNFVVSGFACAPLAPTERSE